MKEGRNKEDSQNIYVMFACIHAWFGMAVSSCVISVNVGLCLQVDRNYFSIYHRVHKALGHLGYKSDIMKNRETKAQKTYKKIYSSYFKLSNILFMLNTSFHLIITVKTKTVSPPLNNFKSQ